MIDMGELERDYNIDYPDSLIDNAIIIADEKLRVTKLIPLVVDLKCKLQNDSISCAPLTAKFLVTLAKLRDDEVAFKKLRQHSQFITVELDRINKKLALRFSNKINTSEKKIHCMSIFYIFEKGILAEMKLDTYCIVCGTLVLLLILYRFSVVEIVLYNVCKQLKKLHNLNEMKILGRESEKCRLTLKFGNILKQGIGS